MLRHKRKDNGPVVQRRVVISALALLRKTALDLFVPQHGTEAFWLGLSKKSVLAKKLNLLWYNSFAKRLRTVLGTLPATGYLSAFFSMGSGRPPFHLNLARSRV